MHHSFGFIVDLLTTTSTSPNSAVSHPVTDLEILERSLQSVSDMLDRVLSYVQSVLAGEVRGNSAVGRYLMDALGASTEDPEKGGFNASLQVCYVSSISLLRVHPDILINQDTLMVSYLANLVRSQAEVSARLALVTAT